MRQSTKKIIVGAIIVAVLLAVGFVGSLVWGKTFRMAQANRDLTAGRTAAARKTYEDLAVDLPESPHVLHNLGLAAAQQGRYQPAGESFQKALQALQQIPGNAKQLRKLAAKCHYQLGNAQFKMAEASQTKANASQQPPTELYRNALANFRDTLERTPADQEAKYNYELTKLRLDNAKSQNQPDQKNQQQKQQNKDHKQQKQSNQPDQKQQSGQDQKQSPGPKSQVSKGNDQNRPNNQKRGMTKQEARALLDAAENGDQYLAPMIRDNSPVQKDW
jgi:hypothetical protein